MVVELGEFLEQLGMVDESGSGIPEVVEATLEYLKVQTGAGLALLAVVEIASKKHQIPCKAELIEH